LILAAGLKGIEEKYELPACHRGRRLVADRRRATRAGPATPAGQSLEQAIIAMENSELVAETLGEHVFDFFLRNKKAEWAEYKKHVTRFELDRYLSL
jgi:glutamine synthetase